MTQPTYHFGGSGPLIHLALANGFPPQTYEPLFAPMKAEYEIVSYPPRGFWMPSPNTSTAPNWRVMADDILAALDAANQRDVIAIGHSMGGVATMIAAAKEPERFRGCVMLDPVILPPMIHTYARFMQWLGLHARAPLSKKALARKAQFESVDDAYQYFRGKRLFNDWNDDVLRLYAEGLTVSSHEDDDGVVLRWTPRWEAHYYQTLETTTWSWLRKLKGKLPVMAIRGSTSNTFFPPVVKKIQKILPDITTHTIEGHGHLFPQSNPEQTRTLLLNWLAQLT